MQTKLKASAVFIIVFLASHAAIAQNCKNPATQMDMNQCASAELVQETARINATYNALRTTLDAETKAKLKNVQLAWIKYKDLACNLEASSMEGGSMHSMVLSTCLTRITRQRNKELQELQSEGAL